MWQCNRTASFTKTSVIAVLLLGVYPKELKAGIQTHICTPLFIAALFTIARGGSNLSIYQQISG